MKKYLAVTIISCLLFLIVGFLYGKSLNESGRYIFKDYDDAKVLFDTTNGTLYIKYKNSELIKRVNYVKKFETQIKKIK